MLTKPFILLQKFATGTAYACLMQTFAREIDIPCNKSGHTKECFALLHDRSY